MYQTALLQDVQQQVLPPNTISIDLYEAYERSDNQPEEWTSKDVSRAIDRYVRFFQLAAKYKNQSHAPTRDIDVIWHLHMLSPRAYYQDCMDTFGEIFDHDGGFGKGDGELDQLKDVFRSTAELWEFEFGEPYVADGRGEEEVTKCWHDCQGRCWHACASG